MSTSKPSRKPWPPKPGARASRSSKAALLKFVHGGEYHAYNPDVVNTLQAAVQQGDYSKFKEYTSLVDNRPVSMIRDLLKVKHRSTPRWT